MALARCIKESERAHNKWLAEYQDGDDYDAVRLTADRIVIFNTNQ